VGAISLAIAAATALIGLAASAQGAQPSLVIDVGDCVDLKAPGQRLDCFERHVEAAKAANRPPSDPPPQARAATPVPAPATASGSPPAAAAAIAGTAAAAIATAPPPTPAPPTAAPVTTSTATAPPPQATPVAPVSAAASTSPQPVAASGAAASSTDTAGFPRPPPPEIVATVTELRETVPNAWLITLDNGQVWRQSIPQRFALKPGQRVTLHGTKWGASYRLSADALHGFIQVERVR
jgi:hypothetical protein